MKHVLRRMAALVALGSVGALSACGVATPFSRPPAMDNGVGVVVGSSANEPRLTAAQWAAELDELVGDGTTLALVSAEGETAVLASWRITLSANASDAGHELEAEVARVASGAAATAARTPETDPWGALAAARRALGDVSACTLLTSSSFLSTTLPLDLQRLGLGLDAADLAAQLAEADALPDLSGCTVVVLALGQTAGTQPGLDERARATLTELVATLLALAGAEVDVSRTLGGDPPAEGLPPVTPVPVVPFAPQATALPTDGSDAGPASDPACQVEIADAAVGFVANEATFLDDEAARATIETAAAALSGCDLDSLTVFATTSSAGTAEQRLALSDRRGLALATPLAAALGVDVASVTVTGLGYCEHPAAVASAVTCVDDRPGGAFDAVLAAENRRAVVRAEPVAG